MNDLAVVVVVDVMTSPAFSFSRYTTVVSSLESVTSWNGYKNSRLDWSILGTLH